MELCRERNQTLPSLIRLIELCLQMFTVMFIAKKTTITLREDVYQALKKKLEPETFQA